VEASKVRDAPVFDATRAFQMLAIWRSITKPRLQSRSDWVVLLRIVTSPWNPLFQSFVTLKVTVAWANSTVTEEGVVGSEPKDVSEARSRQTREESSCFMAGSSHFMQRNKFPLRPDERGKKLFESGRAGLLPR